MDRDREIEVETEKETPALVYTKTFKHWWLELSLGLQMCLLSLYIHEKQIPNGERKNPR